MEKTLIVDPTPYADPDTNPEALASEKYVGDDLRKAARAMVEDRLVNPGLYPEPKPSIDTFGVGGY